MNTVFHPELPAIRHRELLEQRETDRRVAAVRRQRKARRLSHRAAVLAERAAALVERTTR